MCYLGDYVDLSQAQLTSAEITQGFITVHKSAGNGGLGWSQLVKLALSSVVSKFSLVCPGKGEAEENLSFQQSTLKLVKG